MFEQILEFRDNTANTKEIEMTGCEREKMNESSRKCEISRMIVFKIIVYIIVTFV